MRRTKFTMNVDSAQLTMANAKVSRIRSYEAIATDLLARSNLSSKLGWSYEDDRRLYKALGYPEEADLNWKYYWNKYDRNEVASAIINRPVRATWKGELAIVEPDTNVQDSPLNKKWKELNKQFKIKARLKKLDTLTGIGNYAVMLFGLNDIKQDSDWKNPVQGKRNLVYIKQVSETEAVIDQWETDSSNERYGKPKIYRVKIAEAGKPGNFKDLLVHHSRILHVIDNSLVNEVYGIPRLKAVINRLVDVEKLLGGDAEMFWRGARPGYHAKPEEGYSIGEDEESQLETELDKYEHDLRRFITATGVDITALEQQVVDPSSHLDVQLQAISAQTGIPKRILVGSERGELSSSQDADQWNSLIQERKEEYAEPEILRPFIDKLIEYKILVVKDDEYNVLWEDMSTPSEVDKVNVGKKRAEALKTYADSLMASEIFPPKLAAKYLFGLSDEEYEELIQAVEEQQLEEDEDELQARRAQSNGKPTNEELEQELK